MRGIVFIVLTLALLSLPISCNSKREAPGDSGKEKKTVIESSANAERKTVEIDPGREVYNKYCLTCHQADGSGVPGMYPPLVNAEMITGTADDLIRIILFGLEGPIGPEGISYSQVMPAQDFISDSDIVLLVNYLRETWGADHAEVTADDVKRIRTSGKK